MEYRCGRGCDAQFPNWIQSIGFDESDGGTDSDPINPELKAMAEDPWTQDLSLARVGHRNCPIVQLAGI